MNQKSILKNYLYNLTYQILILILPLITASYLSRVLGARGNRNIYIYIYYCELLYIIWITWNFNVWTKRNCLCTGK